MPEMKLKEWLMIEAERLGMTAAGIFYRMRRGLYPGIKVRRVNPRLVYVTVPEADMKAQPPRPNRAQTCECGKPKPPEAAACERCSKTEGAGHVVKNTRMEKRVRQEVNLRSSGAYFDESNYAPIAGSSLAVLNAKLKEL